MRAGAYKTQTTGPLGLGFAGEEVDGVGLVVEGAVGSAEEDMMSITEVMTRKRPNASGSEALADCRRSQSLENNGRMNV